MNGWRIEMSDNALADADAMPASDLPAILRAIRLLGRDPSKSNIKKLKGDKGRWRIRVGNWRVFFRFNQEEHIIKIAAITDRKDAY